MTQARVQQLPALTGIRIVAAAWVVLGHFSKVMFGLFPETHAGASLIQGGYLGVEMFFILSGFIISHNYGERFRHFSISGYGRFLQNRLARLYPVHLVTLLAVVGLVVAAGTTGISLNSQGKYDPVSFLMNVLMLQGLPPAEAWNGPAWSISAEAGAYVAFPLVALFVMRSSGPRAAIGAGVALVFTIAALNISAAVTDFSPTSYSSIWFRIAGEFVAGCFLWKLWNERRPSSIRYDYLAVASGIGIGVVLAVTGPEAVGNFMALPLIALLVLACASSAGPVKTLLSSKLFDYGGRISYSLYMVHFLVLMVAGKLMPWERYEDSGWIIRVAVLVAYFASAAAGAIFLYHCVETPGRRWIAGLKRSGPEGQTLHLRQNASRDEELIPNARGQKQI